MEHSFNALKDRFSDGELLLEALTHTSYANEHSLKNADNERLEFLGDSVLSVIVSDFLFKRSPSLPEGELTRIRAALVCEQALYGYALKLGLGEHIRLGKGEQLTGGAQRPSILSDCFEAVIAALYLQCGMEAAREFIMDFIAESCEEAMRETRDYKTQLQEVIQQNREERLRYVVVSESGPDHDKLFRVDALLNSNVIGSGSGHSKKAAEQAAAAEALKLMGL